MTAVTIVLPILFVCLAVGLFARKLGPGAWALVLLGIIAIIVANFPWAFG